MLSDVSRAEVVRLLDAFLSGALGFDLRLPVKDSNELPECFRAHLGKADGLGRSWTAWVTDNGYLLAWGDYDREQSRRIRAHVLFIEWYLPTAEHHASWWYCYPDRPREWICGRGENRPTFHA